MIDCYADYYELWLVIHKLHLFGWHFIKVVKLVSAKSDLMAEIFQLLRNRKMRKLRIDDLF